MRTYLPRYVHSMPYHVHTDTLSSLFLFFRWLHFPAQTLSRTKMEPSTGPCRGQWCADHLNQPPPRRAVTVQAERAGISRWCRHGCVVLKAGCPKCSTFRAPQTAENPCDRFRTISLRFNPRFRNQGERWRTSLVKEGKKGLRSNIPLHCNEIKLNKRTRRS